MKKIILLTSILFILISLTGLAIIKTTSVLYAGNTVLPDSTKMYDIENQYGSVLAGIDVLKEIDFQPLKGKNIGLITNHTGVDKNLKSTADLLFEEKDIKLKALFGPEHGVRGYETAGKKLNDYFDSLTGLKVYSLYGTNKKPTRAMLRGLDALVYDIQDIGVRSYTYISTMGLAMEAAAENGLEFYVLDRPNPMGGLKVEGNLAREEFLSFVGKFKIPYVYGLTAGELASLINKEGFLKNGKQCDLYVIKMSGWQRDMYYDDTGMIWIPPSSHVPHTHTPFYLAATGILGELRNISNGIGYTIPFQTVAAEWINPVMLADSLNSLNLSGIKFRPITYTPKYSYGEDSLLHGVQFHITDFSEVELMAPQFYFLRILHNNYPDKSLLENTEGLRIKMFDLVLGTDKIRTDLLENYKNVENIIDLMKKESLEFKLFSRKYYLYN